MKAPRRIFRKRKTECDVLITPEDHGRNIILGDPDLADLQGYGRPIRRRWWRAYRAEQIENPIVVAVHKRSRLARERGLTEGEDFTFLAVSTADADREGWPVDPMKANRPPTMIVLLATGDEVQGHVSCDMTPAGVIDAAHFDEAMREDLLQRIPEADRPAVMAYIERPWLYV
jgi:hypothetical protein